MAFETHIIPVLNDNYIFLLHQQSTNATAVVDPAESGPVIDFLKNKDWSLGQIFITHHHWDHVGGIEGLKEEYSCEVFAGYNDQGRIPACDHWLNEGDILTFGDSEAEIIELPGHTLGHIAYHFSSEKALFSGDTVFAMGCGRLFEGTPQQMKDSLEKIKGLHPDTRIYCTHEYTLKNAEFSLTIEPENSTLQMRRDEVKKMRDKSLITIPTKLSLELQTNPFLRAKNTECFAEIRKKRDNF